MDFLTALPYIAILLLALVNAWIVRHMKVAVRDEDED